MPTIQHNGYTIHYEAGRMLRSGTRYEPADYADDELIAVFDGDRELTDEEIAAMGWTSWDFPR
jgi:hypothetical protein